MPCSRVWRAHPLPLCKQAKTLKLSRSSVYYRPGPVGDTALTLMRRIDELHLERPFAGSSQRRRPPKKDAGHTGYGGKAHDAAAGAFPP